MVVPKMNNLNNYKIADNLVPSIDSPNTKELATVIDKHLTEVNQQSEVVLLYPRINNLSENLIDELAVQFHVDFYDGTMSLDKKRAVVKNSIKWHMKKGTPYAVEELIQTIFQSAKVVEWFDYGAAPYHFKVIFIKEPLTDPAQIDILQKAINSVKNTRSWCDELNFLSEQSGTTYVGGYTSIYDVIEINPVEYTPKNVVGQASFGGYTAIFEIVKIEERRNENG